MNKEHSTVVAGHGSLSAGLALLDDLPQLDVAVTRLVKALSDEDIGERELAGIIDQCPTLSGKIVGLANSAYFRRNKPIHSLQDAIMLVGMRTVKSFAIATALQEPFSNQQCPSFRPGRFWLHGILTAHAARELSKKAEKKLAVHPEEAYLSGLLHDIGLLALAHLYPEALNDLLVENEIGNESLASRTEGMFGVTYRLVGAALLRYWHLPDSIITIAEHYHNPDYRGPYWALSGIVGTAHEWATNLVQQESSSPFNAARSRMLGISSDDAETVRKKCLEQLTVNLELSEIISGAKPEFYNPAAIADAALELKDRLVDTIGSLSSIRSLSDLDIRDKNESEILKDALKILMEHQDMQRCSIFLNKDSTLVNVSGLGWDEHFVNEATQEKKSIATHTFALGEGIIGMVAKSGEMKHARNCAVDPLFKKLATHQDYVPGSLICVPVRFQDITLGVLNVSHSKPNVFSEWHERFLMVYANMLGQLIVYNRVIRDMDSDITLRTKELQEALARAESLSTHDDLTGIYNRRYFIEHFNKLIQQCDRYNTKAAVLMIDIDNFKSINDTYGHLEGDKTLIKVAEAISQCARESDIVARLGGEEFIFALQQNNCDKAVQVAKRILEKIRQLDCGENVTYRITASIGISCYDQSIKAPQKCVEKIMQEADKALYKAKHSGKDCIAVHAEP